MKAQRIQPTIGIEQAVSGRVHKPLSPEEHAALTCGRISGRSSLKQQDFLADLGVPRATSVRWTKYRASQMIAKLKPSNPAPARVTSGTSHRPHKGPPSVLVQNHGKTHIQAGAGQPAPEATPRIELRGGRGDHAPQVNYQTEKAATAGI